jgi:hypothetical protein
MVFEGVGTTKDEKKGIQMLEECIEAGLTAAQGTLGCYLSRGGHERTPEEGLKLLADAAEKRDVRAMVTYGKILYSKSG